MTDTVLLGGAVFYVVPETGTCWRYLSETDVEVFFHTPTREVIRFTAAPAWPGRVVHLGSFVGVSMPLSQARKLREVRS